MLLKLSKLKLTFVVKYRTKNRYFEPESKKVGGGGQAPFWPPHFGYCIVSRGVVAPPPFLKFGPPLRFGPP